MAIDVRELSNRILDPVITEELDTYERTVQEYLDGRVVTQGAQEQLRHSHGRPRLHRGYRAYIFNSFSMRSVNKWDDPGRKYSRPRR